MPAAAPPTDVLSEVRTRFGEAGLVEEAALDNVPTVWVPPASAAEVLGFLKRDVHQPYRMLFDLTAIDERVRRERNSLPASDLTVVYTLFSYERNEYVRVKAALPESRPSLPSIARLWPSANWYERETYDMFGVTFEGHPHLARILMPPTWEGYPLRKDHPARATEMGPYELPTEKRFAELEALRFDPAAWGMEERRDGVDFLFLNLGPQHPGTHGVFRILLQLDGEEIVDCVPDIGYHHRAAEKMGERQTWHTYIPYTDRVDYLGGVVNNLAYLTAVERLAGIEAPPRAQVVRVMMSELFRIMSHLVWYGTFAQDVGQMSPVFYTFNDRERGYAIIEAVTGFRMHPAWFRIGGLAADLPRGWERLFREFLSGFSRNLAEYNREIIRNEIFQARTRGIGGCSADEAIEWGMTGPNLRACGFEWDLRKRQPYSGYEQFEFDVPTGTTGDCFDRAVVRIEEMRQSVRIIEQCVAHMPEGPIKADHPLTTPPPKDRTLHDIETLIAHFLHVSWGPVMPPGEVLGVIEGTKGSYGYHLVSDGGTQSYRTRIRTASFPHMQMLPLLSRGLLVPDLLAILGSLDYVLSDVDR
ncbi:MAG TPA: NADH-quinone oxidoreductase subunit C/D [Vicinamibacterales bacterium]|nr:NADH-quinone oxidoreductase subunit C/D [Vicinamibacterales bacterium]